MRINNLKVANLRVFEQAGFDFQQGMNLLVGENGAGKTIILDALRGCLSQVLPQITASRRRPFPFGEEDIRADADFMTINCSFEFQEEEFTYSVRKSRTNSVSGDTANHRERIGETSDGEYFLPPLPGSLQEFRKAKEQPLGVFFSTRRSLVSDASPSRVMGGQAAAFADALSHRELHFQEIARWMGALEAQGAESPLALKHLSVLKETGERFLPGCRDLRAEMSAKPRLVMDKEGKTFDLRQLSAGERGVFALVLDLALRLTQANPGLPDPIRDGSAIVLIDEIELHLHPKWQRTIVRQLTETFRNCQFIATTNSPQVVSSMKPEQVLFLKGDEVKRAQRSLGMDSNWILRVLMEADERSPEATAAIEEVEALMKEWDLETARLRIAERRREGFDLPYWVVLEARMARMEDLFE